MFGLMLTSMIDAVLDLLEIGAVQAAADQVGGPHSRVDHLLGCLTGGALKAQADGRWFHSARGASILTWSRRWLQQTIVW